MRLKYCIQIVLPVFHGTHYVLVKPVGYAQLFYYRNHCRYIDTMYKNILKCFLKVARVIINHLM